MNTEIDNLTMSETLSSIEDLIQQKKNAYVVTPNVDHIVKLESNEKLRAAYSEASLILTDGKPLIWASKLYRRRLRKNCQDLTFSRNYVSLRQVGITRCSF